MRRRQGILVLLFSASLKLPSKMGFKEFLLLLSRSLSLQIKSLQRLEAGIWKLGSSAQTMMNKM